MPPEGKLVQREKPEWLSKIGDRHVVFLSLKFLPMFGGQKMALRTLGFADDRVSEIFEDFSIAPSPQSIERIYAGLRKCSEARVPLILIVNPAVAAKLLFSIFEHLDLLEVIEKIVLIQPVLRESSEKIRLAIKRLAPTYSRKLDSCLYYVRSEQSSADAQLLFKFLIRRLSKYGPNDGISLTKDQKLDDFGHDLGVRKGGHGDLFDIWPLAARNRKQIQAAFMEEILQKIYAR
jgi:hypothetical protein